MNTYFVRYLKKKDKKEKLLHAAQTKKDLVRHGRT
jgi:hypothetical protein